MYEDILGAIEDCFQVYTALHSWPELTCHIWQFITELVFEIKSGTKFTNAFPPSSYIPISQAANIIKNQIE